MTILHLTKLKGFADNKLNMTEELKFGFERVENFCQKGRKGF